ncbi:MAG TPA: hypothetical protein VNA20_00370 [Frankiaceae bacterium]|nr:hypothetical protein [Frankiaceae bacterium]
MRRGRLAGVLAAAVLAVASFGTPAAAERLDRADIALPVPADGTTVTTPFVTSPNAAYLLSVSGVFAYDRFGNLADCGRHDIDYGVVGQYWVDGGGIGLTIDGAFADCWYQNAPHTYLFWVDGTGDRLSFAVGDATGHADNAGALTVSVVTMIEASGSCHHAFVPIPNSSYGDLAVAAEARHTGADMLWPLEVDCHVFVDGSLVAVANTSALAPAVAAGAYVPSVQLGPVRRCLTVRVLSWPTYERVYPCATT